MSQYFSAFAFLLMVMSPPLIPVVVTVVHRVSVGIRAVANRRRTEQAASLA
jgi:hypothetical protein